MSTAVPVAVAEGSGDGAAAQLELRYRSAQLFYEKLKTYPIKGMGISLAEPLRGVIQVCLNHPRVREAANPDVMFLKCVKSLLGHAAKAVYEVEKMI
ncbi:MAG: hypothetical protein DRJ67_03705 [Thermoprotei archaeon]|nr:MAG: hypothetical protein DRJ67_03705 [Thermoprotei archaeon]